jgi:hypothetical protein
MARIYVDEIYPGTASQVTLNNANAQNSTFSGISSFTGSVSLPNISFKNKIINGDMNIHQRSASVSGITTSSYNTADRWVVDISSHGTWTQTVELSDAPTGTGIRKSLKMLCTTANASPSAGNNIKIRQTIEAQNCNIFKIGSSSAESITISFWVKSNVTGTYIVELENQTSGSTRIVCGSYTINSSAVWEKKSITVSGDTVGVVNNDNGIGLLLAFYLGAGTNFTSGTLQTTWGTTVSANRAVGQTNVASATNNYWQVTGVQIETGRVATEFEILPYDIQLMRCQRYYISYTISQDYSDGSNNGVVYRAYSLPFPMRIAPTPVILSQFTYFSSATATNFTPTFTSSINAVSVLGTGLTAGRGLVGGTFGANAEL